MELEAPACKQHEQPVRASRRTLCARQGEEMRHRSFSYRGKAWWLSIMTPNFDAIPLERAVCAWCSRCVASVCFRIEGEVHPAATLVTGWGRTTLGRGKHRASGQRDAIHDRSVFGAQLTFDRPTSSSGSQHRQRVVHHTFQGHDSGCPQCSRSIRLSRSASSAFRTPRVVKLRELLFGPGAE